MHVYREPTAEEKEIIRKHQLWLGGAEGGERANLRGANLCEITLCNVNLHKADLSNADLSGADLRGANLTRANMREANLVEADLSYANLLGAKLNNADMREACMHGTFLTGADLNGAFLNEADMRGANFDYSSWPLHCGSIGVIADDRLVAQLAFHLTRLDTSKCSEKVQDAMDVIKSSYLTNLFCEYCRGIYKIQPRTRRSFYDHY